ncbi:hypothetical protein J437_LFUL002571 [Ladona fulva]|uniref:Uncharacterized protein n=1 Tax=Ladona fulva TaxID=123851 RepID=A0A8K0NVJ7_LADFU|nr:hypothetical protein J437_LFUL002571 [Ladona fulva]
MWYFFPCFLFSYDTGNGISAQESGYLKNPGIPGLEAQVAQGRYSFTAPDGTRVSVQYIADEGGFRPVVKITPP